MIIDELTECSGAHCILRSSTSSGGMQTNGGCLHLAKRGGELQLQLRTMGAEIVALREELARVKGAPPQTVFLPATCGTCQHWISEDDPQPGGSCDHPEAPCTSVAPELEEADGPPPHWCPLRKRRPEGTKDL